MELKIGDLGQLRISAIHDPLAGRIVRRGGRNQWGLAFDDPTPRQREELIVKLFTGNYDNEVHEAGSFGTLFSGLFRRAFGEEWK